MKTQSTIKPEKFKVIELGIKKEIVLCENITNFTNEENEVLYEYDMTMQTVDKDSDLIAEFIHLKYDYDDEIALLNKGLLDNQDIEYLAYRDYVEEVKEFFN